MNKFPFACARCRYTGIEYAANRSVCVAKNGGVAHTQPECANQHCYSKFQHNHFRTEKYGSDGSQVIYEMQLALRCPGCDQRINLMCVCVIFIRSGFGPDPRTSKFEIKSRVPVLTSESNYKSTMNLFSLPITTEGISNTTLSECHSYIYI